MILGRIKMIALAVAGSAFIGMGGLIWWLYADNQSLASDKQALEQTNDALAESARSHKALADDLQASIQSRDEISKEYIEQRTQSEQQLEKARQKLYEALQDNECANQPHPAAAGDWLRKHSDSL